MDVGQEDIVLPEIAKDTYKAYKLYRTCKDTSSRVYGKGREYVRYARELSTALLPAKYRESTWWDDMCWQQKANFLTGVILLVVFISVILYIVYRTRLAKSKSADWSTAALVGGILLWSGIYHIYLAFQPTAHLKNDIKWVDYMVSLTLMIIVSLSTLNVNEVTNQDTAFVYMGAVAVGLMVVWCGWWSENTESKKVKWGALVLAVGFTFGAFASANDMWKRRQFSDHMHYGEWDRKWGPAIVTSCFVIFLLLIQFLNTTFTMKAQDYEALHLWFGLTFKTAFITSYGYQFVN